MAIALAPAVAHGPGAAGVPDIEQDNGVALFMQGGKTLCLGDLVAHAGLLSVVPDN